MSIIGGLAEATIFEILAKATGVLSGASGTTKIFSSASKSFVLCGTGGGGNGATSEVAEDGVDLAWNGARHTEKAPRGDERDNFDGHAKDEKNGFVGGSNNDPSDKRAGAKECGEHGVEDEH